MTLTLSDYYYDLPESRIATTPAHPRDSAKLMVVDRTAGRITDHIFRDLGRFLTGNDVLVLNDTKVFPARLKGIKLSGGAAEVLLLRPDGVDTWEAMSHGLKPGQSVRFSAGLTGAVLAKDPSTGHIRIELVQSDKTKPLSVLIDRIGQIPVPPYIHSPLSESELRREYQTVYARETGSAAAPTAGLHFTDDLISHLAGKGVQMEHITLHVGPGTFAKVLPGNLAAKTLHSEWYSIKPDVAARLNQAKRMGKRIIAVGTTAARTLESAYRDGLQPGSGTTNLFIMPPYRFAFVDSLITNFHLPESSLLMLVAAFVSRPNTASCFSAYAGSIIGKAYTRAVRTGYRFFSFGDAMWIR